MERLDKRHIAGIFRERLSELIDQKGESVSAFARNCGLDRSALSQFLNSNSTRLPRSETLAAIAASQELSIDWLLGLSQDRSSIAQIASVFSIEQAGPEKGVPLLSAWHNEAAGYKIRYSPSSLPDLLRTPALIAYEFGARQEVSPHAKADLSKQQLDYSRLPETDMEAVLPMQRLQDLAGGTGIWGGLQRGARQAQIEHMIGLIEELYPTFRLFLYDGLKHFCAPFTVFGPKRAAVYLGDSYLVVNSSEHIRELSRRFDNMIRVSEIGPDRVADWVRELGVG